MRTASETLPEVPDPSRVMCAWLGCPNDLRADPRHIDNLMDARWRCRDHRGVELPDGASVLTGVRFLDDGRPCLVLTAGEDLRALVEFVDRADRAEAYAARMPVPAAGAFVGAGRQVLAIAELVPQSEPQHASTPPTQARWVTTQEAADLLGVGDRAVRKRIARGSLIARRLGGQWLIDVKEIADAVA